VIPDRVNENLRLADLGHGMDLYAALLPLLDT